MKKVTFMILLELGVSFAGENQYFFEGIESTQAQENEDGFSGSIGAYYESLSSSGEDSYNQQKIIMNMQKKVSSNTSVGVEVTGYANDGEFDDTRISQMWVATTI